MEIVESEKKAGEAVVAGVAFFVARTAVVGVLITVAAWLITNAALDWLGAPLLK